MADLARIGNDTNSTDWDWSMNSTNATDSSDWDWDWSMDNSTNSTNGTDDFDWSEFEDSMAEFAEAMAALDALTNSTNSSDWDWSMGNSTNSTNSTEEFDWEAWEQAMADLANTDWDWEMDNSTNSSDWDWEMDNSTDMWNETDEWDWTTGDNATEWEGSGDEWPSWEDEQESIWGDEEQWVRFVDEWLQKNGLERADAASIMEFWDEFWANGIDLKALYRGNELYDDRDYEDFEKYIEIETEMFFDRVFYMVEGFACTE